MILPSIHMVFSRIYQAWINMSILCIPMLVLGGGSESQSWLLLKSYSVLNIGNLALLPHSKWAPQSVSLEVAYKPGICSMHLFAFKVTLACFKNWREVCWLLQMQPFWWSHTRNYGLTIRDSRLYGLCKNLALTAWRHHYELERMCSDTGSNCRSYLG